MATTTTRDKMVGRDFTVRRDGFPWTHGRCVRVRYSVRGGVTSLRLLFPDGNERWFRADELMLVVVY